MTFQPVVPLQGIAGWQFLQRTYQPQFEAFNTSSEVKRDTDYFAENIGQITSAEALVSDRRLLSVALGAFGLGDDIDNTFFVRRILEDGTMSDDALANRLSDDRYKRFSEAFGFGPREIVSTQTSGFADRILSQYRAASFEVAVGEQDETMRIALYAQRELDFIVSDNTSDRAQWFSMMSVAPLRSLFETALGLPEAFGQLDIDKQLEIFQSKSRATFGTETFADFLMQDTQDDLINTYLARAQLQSFDASMSSASVALTLLSSIAGG